MLSERFAGVTYKFHVVLLISRWPVRRARQLLPIHTDKIDDAG